MSTPGPDSSRESAPAGFNLVEFSTRRRVTVAMVTITFLLFGFIALNALKVNLLPDLSYPTLTVRTEYTGAAPSEIETLISEPVEEAVGVVKNLRKLKSVSRTGQSDVVLEFAWGTDMDQAGLEVRDKMEVLQLPLEAKAPVLLRFNPSTEPIMRIVLSASGERLGATADRTASLRRRRPEEEAGTGRRRRRGQGRRRPRGRNPGRHRPAETRAAQPADRYGHHPARTGEHQHFRRSPGGRHAALPGAYRQPVRQRQRNPRHAGDHAVGRRRRRAERGRADGARGGRQWRCRRHGRGGIGAERLVVAEQRRRGRHADPAQGHR